MAYGRDHLLELVREGILHCDRSSLPYTYYRTTDCKVNQRLGPDIDYDQFFKQRSSGIRERSEKTLKGAKEGTEFIVTEFLKSLNLPYQDVPAIRRKYLLLLINIFIKMSRSGYLAIAIPSRRSPLIYIRTNYE